MNDDAAKIYFSVKEALEDGALEPRGNSGTFRRRATSPGVFCPFRFEGSSAALGDSVLISLSPSPPLAEEIDVSGLTACDLQRLLEDDPFMYYSIPEMRGRLYRLSNGEDADVVADAPQQQEEALEGDAAGGPEEVVVVGSPRRSSCPAGLLAAAFASSTAARRPRARRVVARRSRISAEAHPAVASEALDFAGEVACGEGVLKELMEWCAFGD